MHATRSLRQWTLGLVVVVLAACGSGSSGSGGGSGDPMPTASIVVSGTVPVNDVLTLNGNGSTTANGNPVTFAWTLTSKPTGSAATISNVAIAAPTITPDLVGTYAFNLVVSDGSKTTSISSSTTAVVTTPPTIITDILPPLSGTVELNLNNLTGVSTVTWLVDGTSIGTGMPLAWDTTTVANGSHVVVAQVVFLGNYAINLTTSLQVTQSAISLTGGAINAANGIVSVIVGATSANGIVRVDATLDGVAIGSLAVPNACLDLTGVTCPTVGLNGYAFAGAVVAGAHVAVLTATDGVGNTLAIQLLLTTT